jgi:hypothetical protein
MAKTPSSIAIWRMPLSKHPDPLVRQAFRELREFRPSYQVGWMLEAVAHRVQELRRAARREREIDAAWRRRERVYLPAAAHY